eukprot:1068684-Pelagomonas_calceolata.AAC.2
MSSTAASRVARSQQADISLYPGCTCTNACMHLARLIACRIQLDSGQVQMESVSSKAESVSSKVHLTAQSALTATTPASSIDPTSSIASFSTKPALAMLASLAAVSLATAQAVEHGATAQVAPASLDPSQSTIHPAALDSCLQVGAILTSSTKGSSPAPLRVPSGFAALAVPLVLPMPPQPNASSSGSSMQVAQQRGGGALPRSHWSSCARAATPPATSGGRIQWLPSHDDAWPPGTQHGYACGRSGRTDRRAALSLSYNNEWRAVLSRVCNNAVPECQLVPVSCSKQHCLRSSKQGRWKKAEKQETRSPMVWLSLDL